MADPGLQRLWMGTPPAPGSRTTLLPLHDTVTLPISTAWEMDTVVTLPSG